LGADIAIEEEQLGVLPDGSISRYNVIGRVDWTLTRNDRAANKASPPIPPHPRLSPRSSPSAPPANA
jgi:allophanate hydrolase subunit 1